MRHALFFIPASLLSLGLVACAPPAPTDLQTGCDASHARVGETATLQTRHHDVAGEVEIVDDCTLRISDFHFDGNGLDVRLLVAEGEDYENGIILTDDLRRSEGYEGEDLEFKLPVGVSLDDFDSLSIWCVPAGVSFGDATL